MPKSRSRGNSVRVDRTDNFGVTECWEKFCSWSSVVSPGEVNDGELLFLVRFPGY